MIFLSLSIVLILINLYLTACFAIYEIHQSSQSAPFDTVKKLDIPEEHKEACLKCFYEAREAGKKVLLASLAAPVVVAIALPFHNRENGQLPNWARNWNNDVSNWGDQPWIDKYGDKTKSMWYMYRFIGLRNRAMYLAQILGTTWKNTEALDREVIYGDPAVTNRDRYGVTLSRGEQSYFLVEVKKAFGPLCIMRKYGYAMWGELNPHIPIMRVVTTGWSLIRFKG